MSCGPSSVWMCLGCIPLELFNVVPLCFPMDWWFLQACLIPVPVFFGSMTSWLVAGLHQGHTL